MGTQVSLILKGRWWRSALRGAPGKFTCLAVFAPRLVLPGHRDGTSRDSRVDPFPCPTPPPGPERERRPEEEAESPPGKRVVLEKAAPRGPHEASCAFPSGPRPPGRGPVSRWPRFLPDFFLSQFQNTKRRRNICCPFSLLTASYADTVQFFFPLIRHSEMAEREWAEIGFS